MSMSRRVRAVSLTARHSTPEVLHQNLCYESPLFNLCAYIDIMLAYGVKALYILKRLACLPSIIFYQ